MNKATTFKFREINKRMIESLVNAEVYFSLPEQLNDPFDCQIDIRKSIDAAILKVQAAEQKTLTALKNQLEEFFAGVERKMQTFGVWSCSSDPENSVLENSLMWAHYGDEHRGICLTYDLPDTFMDYRLGEVIGLSPVDYEKNPIVDWFIENIKNLSSQRLQDFATPLIVKLLTSKDKCWEYEKEGRVISQYPGIKKIGKSALRQVCFGLKTPQSDKDLVREILNKHGYDVIICEMERDENDFGLRAKEI